MSDDEAFERRVKTLAAVDPSLDPSDTITAATILSLSESESVASGADVGFDLPPISVSPDTLGEPPSDEGADYYLLATLGEGGMGRVHLARQRSLSRDVAIKRLKDDAPGVVERALLREARLTGSLEHPGVIPVHALGTDEANRPMLVMKRVDGVDLGTLLANPRHSAWPASQKGDDTLTVALQILVQVCLTVEFAHSRGIIHRDIKPENVMVGGFGEVYLLDWGIAATKEPDEPSTETLLGSPAYMAPEMVIGGDVDERTDVYLLGATLHEILVGMPRHVGATVRDVLRAALASEPFAYGRSVPEALASLCNRATSRVRSERPATAKAFREELVQFQRRRSSQALCVAALQRLRALEELLEAAELAIPSDLALAYRLGTEARFGLTQSLNDGAGDVARGGLERCVTALVDLELRQGHIESAEALLREMVDPPPTLAERIEVFRERSAAHERERARLEMLGREFDPAVLGAKRTAWIIGSAIAVAAIWLAIAIRGKPPTAGWLVVVSLAGNVVVWAVLLFLRESRFNWKMGGLLALAFFASLANRTGAFVFGRTSTIETLMIDLVVFTVVAVAAAIALFRSMAYVGIVMAIGLVAMLEFPEHGVRVFAATAVASLLTGAIVLARASKRA